MAPTPTTYKRVVLSSRPSPTKLLDPAVFSLRHEPFPSPPGNGELLIKVLYLSLDPAMRSWINPSGSYMAPVPLGGTMRSFGLGVIISSDEGCKLKKGDRVQGFFGWTEYALSPEKAATLLAPPPPGAELLDYLGPLGPTGLTAYFGLTDIGQLKKGETLVVTGAAGATGSIVCQLGKLWGAKVFGIAGGTEKCQWLERECGVEMAFDYKTEGWREEFKRVAGRFDVLFDNVGGKMLDFLLTRMNKRARIAVCGGISDYNSRPKGLTNYLALINARARMEGFLIMDYAPRFAEGTRELARMLSRGELRRKFHVLKGVESAPEGLGMLFSGQNTGKLVVQVGEETERGKL
ncbi:NADP-binding protein [Dacryopinax primogenitus]|uniref:NADP-binding protein n=1 Tax=Dacryopinax primogenitus (strain DJM 731) TaxID=1858805 RepID=M5FU82_DACPD|nr:NADP-binding protein [Dacryopinax primogenitus]EJT99743.1 NADP-binding protein [Dacryopinax primogenitus]